MPHTAKLGPMIGSVHEASAKDFDLLRKEDTALEKQVSNLRIVRLALFVVITFLFASAIHRRDDAVIQKMIGDIYRTAGPTTANQLILDPISIYIYLQGDTGKEQLDALVNGLRAQYSQIFTVRFSVLGTELNFDLRLIIVSFPLWLSLAQIYLSILREKRRLIRSVGSLLTTGASPDQITAIDKLTFEEKEGPYRSYPGFLVDLAFWLVITILISMMIWIMDVRATGEGRLFAKLAVIIVMASAFYSAAYSSWVSARLRKEVEVRLGYLLPQDRFGRMWSSANQWLISLPARVRPRLTLTLSSALALSTLALPTAQVGCDHRPARRPPPVPQETTAGKQSDADSQVEVPEQPQEDATGDSRPGYQILSGKADWPPSLSALFLEINSGENFYGRIIYGASLFLAAIGLGWSVFISKGHARRSTLVLSYACAVISVALLCEFSNPWFCEPFLWFWPPALTSVLYLFARLTQRKSPLRADRIYRSLRMGYVTLLLADVVFLGSVITNLPGLVVLFISVHLMTLGYFSALAGM
jgi:hypothetical protein